MTRMRELQLISLVLSIKDPQAAGIVKQSPNIKFMLNNDWAAVKAMVTAGTADQELCQDLLANVSKQTYNEVRASITRDGFNTNGTPKKDLKAVYLSARSFTDLVEQMSPEDNSIWTGVRPHPDRAQVLEMLQF